MDRGGPAGILLISYWDWARVALCYDYGAASYLESVCFLLFAGTRWLRIQLSKQDRICSSKLFLKYAYLMQFAVSS